MKIDKQSGLRLAEATAQCIQACEVCIAHCQDLLATGDKMMADCLEKCLQTLPLCEATRRISNFDSPLVSKLAKVCQEACQACAQVCKPHIEHHSVCKTCYDSCLKCAQACEAA